MRDFLRQFILDFAAAMHAVDARAPVAPPYRAGIGPHEEKAVVSMCAEEMARLRPDRYRNGRCEVKYPGGSRSECDICFGTEPSWDWAIETKLLRFLGDNGKQNGHMLMHILSPYSKDRSALTDCTKLVTSSIARQRAIVIFGYGHDDWPLEPAIAAFELLAAQRVRLGERLVAHTPPLIHPVHQSASVFGWEVLPLLAKNS